MPESVVWEWPRLVLLIVPAGFSHKRGGKAMWKREGLSNYNVALREIATQS